MQPISNLESSPQNGRSQREFLKTTAGTAAPLTVPELASGFRSKPIPLRPRTETSSARWDRNGYHGYVPLGCLSHYSVLRSTVRIPELVDRAKELGLPSVALTDVNNLSGAVELSVESSRAGIKPIYGMTCRVNVSNSPSETVRSIGVRLFATTKVGMANLISLSTTVACNGGGLKLERLEQCHNGLIVVAGCSSGQAKNQTLRIQRPIGPGELASIHDLFGERLYLEVNSPLASAGDHIVPSTVSLANRHGLRLVAVQQVTHMQKEDASLHEVLRAFAQLHHFSMDDSCLSRTTHFQSPEEVYAEFSGLEEAVAETYRLSECIETDVLRQLLLGADCFQRIHGEPTLVLKIGPEAVADFMNSLKTRFGQAQVVTPAVFSRLRSRPLLFVAGAILGLRKDDIQELDDCVDVWIGRSFREVFNRTPRLQQLAESDPKYQKLFAIVERLDGIVRSTEADRFAVAVTREPVANILPLFPDDQNGNPVSQWDRKSLLSLGAQMADLWPSKRHNGKHG